MREQLTGQVAGALVELGHVRASIETEDRAARAAHSILDGHEAALLDAWRGFRARPSAPSARAVRRALDQWRRTWLYGTWAD